MLSSTGAEAVPALSVGAGFMVDPAALRVCLQRGVDDRLGEKSDQVPKWPAWTVATLTYDLALLAVQVARPPAQAIPMAPGFLPKLICQCACGAHQKHASGMLLPTA